MKKLLLKLMCVVLLEIVCNIVAIQAFFGIGIGNIFIPLYDFWFRYSKSVEEDPFIHCLIPTIIVILFQLVLIPLNRWKPIEEKKYKIKYNVISIALALYVVLFYVLFTITDGGCELMDFLYPFGGWS